MSTNDPKTQLKLAIDKFTKAIEYLEKCPKLTKEEAIKVLNMADFQELQEPANMIQRLPGDDLEGFRAQLHSSLSENLNKLKQALSHFDESAKASVSSTTNYSAEKKSGCFIATSVYGSYNSPQVIILRLFRNCALNQHMLGRFFITLYYCVSPYLVPLFHIAFVRKLSKKYLNRMINKIIK